MGKPNTRQLINWKTKRQNFMSARQDQKPKEAKLLIISRKYKTVRKIEKLEEFQCERFQELEPNVSIII